MILANNPVSQSSVTAWVKNFSSWKSASAGIKKHSDSTFHVTAANVLNKKGPTVYQSLSEGNQKQMMNNRTALRVIFRTLRFFARQGIPLRGTDNDENSNFLQLLKERAEDVNELETWLKRTEHKWLSHDIQNEILELMANKIVNSVIERIKAADCYSLMIDETPDNSRKEQISVCFRITAEDLTVYEYFIGFYTTPSTKAETLFEIVEDTFIRFGLSFSKLRGQCYDGAKNVSGETSGLQARIRKVESRALFNHCKAHNLNLAVQDGLEKVQEAKNFIGTVKEMINFVRDSPKRNAQFERIQSEIAEAAEDQGPSLVAFCPTRYSFTLYRENYLIHIETIYCLISDG